MTSNSNTPNKEYQQLTLELSDGRTVVTMIPPTFKEGESISIKAVKVTESIPLPDDTSWGTL